MKGEELADGGLRIADVRRRSIRNSKSEIRHSTASFLVGGVNSPVRAFRHIGAKPLTIIRAKGAEVVDSRGRTFVDFIMGWGALILGHNPPVVVRAIRQALERGVLFGLTHPAEEALARLIADAVPSVEQVRFTTSGTEACMTAVKLARAHTGRRAVVAFEGCYHGHGDSLMTEKGAGIPEAARDIVRVPFNDVGAFEKAIQRDGREVACVIIEPVSANMGVVAPGPGYLSRIKQWTIRQGALLIFDEVVTGFRLGRGGAQALFGVAPDLTVFGKIVGGGLPIGAVTGPRRLMQRLAPEGDVYHGGTFAGHPLSMAAGVAALSELESHPPYERLERLSRQLASGVSEAAHARGVAVQVNRAGSMLTVFFSETPVRNEGDAQASQRDRFAEWARRLLDGGVLVPPSPFEALFLSAAHTQEHVERLLRASNAAFRAMSLKFRSHHR